MSMVVVSDQQHGAGTGLICLSTEILVHIVVYLDIVQLVILVQISLLEGLCKLSDLINTC